MDTLTTLATTDELVRDDLRVVGRLVGRLGSTLDLGEIAARALPILSDELGYEVSELVLVDDLDGRLEIVGRTDAPLPDERRWSLSVPLAGALRRGDTFLRIDASWLHPALTDGGDRVAFRLTDGDATVGFVLLPGSHVVESCGVAEDLLVRTLGGLIGSFVSRALVHRALLRVTDRLDGSRRFQQHVLDHVSHEFNTPLMILRSVSEFLDTDDAEERAGFLDMHRQAVERLENLVQGVLEVAHARADTKRQDVTRDAFVDAVLVPVLDRRPWRRRQLVRAIDLPASGALSIDADGCALVLEHLLRNAGNFAIDRGAGAGLSIRLESDAARPVALADALAALEDRRLVAPQDPPDAARPDTRPRLVIEVIDTGIGIPEDERDAVFEPFYQARNSPLRGVSGAGMGLPTMHKRVRAMGGAVHLESAVGRGTRVRVSIPVVRIPETAPTEG